MWHFVGTEIVRGGNAVSRRGPGSQRASGHVPQDPTTGVSGSRCPLPDSAVGAAVRSPADCARLRCLTPRLPPASRGQERPVCCGVAASVAEAPDAPPPPPPAPARSHPTVPCPFCWSRLRYEHRKNSPPDLRNRELTQPSLLVSDVRPGVPCVL